MLFLVNVMAIPFNVIIDSRGMVISKRNVNVFSNVCKTALFETRCLCTCRYSLQLYRSFNSSAQASSKIIQTEENGHAVALPISLIFNRS